MSSLTFRRRFDLTVLPRDWVLIRVSLDWSGNPLLLMAEGKPQEPRKGDAAQAWALWYRAPAKAHHLIHWEGDRADSLRLHESQALPIYHIQPFEEGWLLGERRRGRATIYDRRGRVRAALDLGDASEDLQTTPEGKIWVSYFDEGVFGGGLGADGVICFDSAGTPIFRYRDFARKHNLPPIYDCYAMNVAGNGEVWLNYYQDFPLVLLRNFELGDVWRGFSTMGNSFAIRAREAVYLRDGTFMTVELNQDRDPEIIDAVDELGFPLPRISGRGSTIAARGSNLLIRAGSFIYDLPGGLISSP